MTARRDPEHLIRTYLDDGPTELPDRTYDAVRSEIDHARQRVVFGPWREPRVSNFSRFAIAAVAILAVVAVGSYALPRLGGTAAPAATPTAQPSATAASRPAEPSPTPNATLSPTPTPVSAASPSPLLRTYVTTPFAPPGGHGMCMGPPPQPGCSESAEDDSIRITYTLPDGWSIAPFNSIWLASGENSPPAGAGVIAVRGGWLHSDPCRIDNSSPLVPTGTTVDEFASALAEHPLLEVTAPVDVTLAGYDGKYVDLQAPSDISGCNAYFPWEPGLYAQGPGQRWHLWILDVDGVRVVIQASDYAGTSAQHQAELQAIVDSIQIDPGTAGPVTTATPSSTVNAIELPEVSADLDPGTYYFESATHTNGARVIFTLPAGWTTDDGTAVRKAPDVPSEVLFETWIVDRVFGDVCEWRETLVDAGTSVEQLVSALAAQTGRTASAPTDITVSGFPAKRIELVTPDTEAAFCQGGGFHYWPEPGPNEDITGLWGNTGGTDVVYVVDVAGNRLVILARHRPTSSPQDVAELEAIVESIRIEP